MQSIGEIIVFSIVAFFVGNFGALIAFLCFGDSDLKEAKWVFIITNVVLLIVVILMISGVIG